MTQENKQLLLKDLCARLPYHTIVKYRNADVDLTQYARSVKLTECKPYLRPMSSMTEEEENDLKKITWQFCFHRKFNVIGVGAADDGGCSLSEMTQIITYLISHHFDCHELIPMGLALEAPEGMYRLINSK